VFTGQNDFGHGSYSFPLSIRISTLVYSVLAKCPVALLTKNSDTRPLFR
jgi:hypothetical protein